MARWHLDLSTGGDSPGKKHGYISHLKLLIDPFSSSSFGEGHLGSLLLLSS